MMLHSPPPQFIRSRLATRSKIALQSVCPTVHRPTSRATICAVSAAASEAAPTPADAASTALTDAGTARGTASVVLKRGKARLFREGNPLVFSGAIDRIQGRPAPVAGDAVLLTDGAMGAIGWGAYNPASMFRVRVFQTAAEAAADPESCLNIPALVTQRLQEAAALRRVLGLPGDATDVYRLVNGEGDRLSGLVVDVLGDRAVVQSAAAWCEAHRGAVTAGVAAAADVEEGNVVWQQKTSVLQEEGMTPEEEDDAATTSQEVEVEVREAGVKYIADLSLQKTGFYADQRESRQFLGSVCSGQRVLDLCCYTGAFSLHAALGGAASVVGVDSSEPALQLAGRNAELNGVAGSCSFVKADVAEHMKAAAAEGQQFEVVVLDPPKLAPNKKALMKATRKYQKLNAAAMRLVAPGGLLMTCSCSSAMTLSGEFTAMLQAAARAAGRTITVVREAGAGPDHPLNPSYAESRYLTNVTVRVM